MIKQYQKYSQKELVFHDWNYINRFANYWIWVKGDKGLLWDSETYQVVIIYDRRKSNQK